MAASRVYTVSAGGITVANAVVTLVFLNPPVTKSIEILRCWISQSANATSAQQRVQLVTQVTAFPTLTAATPSKLMRDDPVSLIAGGTAGAAGTAGVNASAEGAGTKTVIFDDAFNVLNGWLWLPTPRETIVIPASSASGFGLYLPVAPATLTNWAFGVTFAEV
jgi:hypothetical protein